MPSSTLRKKNHEDAVIWFAATLFSLSAWWALRAARKNRLNGTDDSHNSSNGMTSRHVHPHGIISSRGEKALNPPIPYLAQFLTCLQDPYDRYHNPSGYIALCVAENKLILDLISERLTQAASGAFMEPSVYMYNSFVGMPVARRAVAYFLARRFYYLPDEVITPEQALYLIQPKHVGLAAGAAPVLNHLFSILGERGDACLIPAPYYAAFENDMKVMAGVEPCRIQQLQPALGPTDEELEIAYRQAKKSGYKPRFVLITNPNNPLGTIYKPAVIRRMVQWARSKQMHTIVDEIYALSTFKKYDHSFQSIIKILNNDLGNDVHMVWALSKDFGSSGIRAGVVYSQNELFMEAMETLSIFSCVSGPIQYLLAELLTDDIFVSQFLDESRARIVHSYNICTKKLEEMVIPFIPAEAGLFVYVDFSPLLPEKTFEYEKRLSDLMFEHARIVLTPGVSQRDSKPGMFRICYTWVSPQVLEVAMERLSKLVSKLRRMDWDDFVARSLSGALL